MDCVGVLQIRWHFFGGARQPHFGVAVVMIIFPRSFLVTTLQSFFFLVPIFSREKIKSNISFSFNNLY